MNGCIYNKNMEENTKIVESYSIKLASEVIGFTGDHPPNFLRHSNLEETLRSLVETPKVLRSSALGTVSRAEVSHALNLILLARLLNNVESGYQYVAEQNSAGRKIFLDHGAVRTVAWAGSENLPQGRELIARILRPLGYFENKTYDLKRLKMTGYSYTHTDFPEDVGQWFVSEFHPDEFSEPFIDAVERTLSSAIDPLSAADNHLLDKLSQAKCLSYEEAATLLKTIVKCFNRIHAIPKLEDYETLLSESPEMAWISTEGTSCNHQTDRVENVELTAEIEREKGRPIKETIEVSGSGRVKQTAHKAPTVSRSFMANDGGVVKKHVPGSFFEFIERGSISEEGSEPVLDLEFDAANAQGIFKMTRSS